MNCDYCDNELTYDSAGLQYICPIHFYNYEKKESLGFRILSYMFCNLRMR